MNAGTTGPLGTCFRGWGLGVRGLKFRGEGLGVNGCGFTIPVCKLKKA